MAKIRDTARPPPSPWASVGMTQPMIDTGEGVQGLLDALALSTTPVPVVGDVAGLASDAYRFATDPESRTLGNAMWASLGMLPFVPAMGAVTRGMGKSKDLAASIRRWAEEMGLSVSHKRSGLSGSQYLEVEKIDDAGNAVSRKVRISDHDLPPSYQQLHGAADYEVGPHSMGGGEGATDAVMWLADQFGAPVPGGMAGAVAKRRGQLADLAAAKEAEIAATSTAHAKIMSDVDKVGQAIGAGPELGERIRQAMAIARNDRRNVAVDRIADELGVARQAVKDWHFRQLK